jgi:hypothetical protein
VEKKKALARLQNKLQKYNNKEHLILEMRKECMDTLRITKYSLDELATKGENIYNKIRDKVEKSIEDYL